jgi:HAD superfamily hydrolase (TIGR01509 family)
MAISVIIFDVDGLLFDSEKLHRKAWEQVFKRRQITLSEVDYAGGVGVSDEDFLVALRNSGRIPASLSVRKLVAEKIPVLVSLADKGARLQPGMRQFLHTLAKQYAFAAASNSDHPFIERLMKNAGIERMFSCVLTRKDVKRPKPAPDIYLLCARCLGVCPDQCCVVEDSPVGIRAAKSAGMLCAAISFTLPGKMLGEADIVLRNPSIMQFQRFLGSAGARQKESIHNRTKAG